MILYSNDCPKCGILKRKLDDKEMEYEIVNDMEIFVSKGFRSMPQLEIDGVVLSYFDAIVYVNGA